MTHPNLFTHLAFALALVMSALAAPAYADGMSRGLMKDTMSRDSMMDKESMMKDSMSKDSMMGRMFGDMRTDSRGYIFGSIGMANYDLSQSDIGPEGLEADSDDVIWHGGIGFRISPTLSFELAMADLGSPVNPKNIAAIVGRKTDFEYDEVYEFSFVNVFDIGRDYKPLGRVGMFSYDGDFSNQDELLFGLGVMRGPFRLEWNYHDFDPEAVNSVVASYLFSF